MPIHAQVFSGFDLSDRKDVLKDRNCFIQALRSLLIVKGGFSSPNVLQLAGEALHLNV